MLGSNLSAAIKCVICSSHFVACGPYLTLFWSWTIRQLFPALWDLRCSAGGSRWFSIAAVTAFLQLVLFVVASLGNATVAQTATKNDCEKNAKN